MRVSKHMKKYEFSGYCCLIVNTRSPQWSRTDGALGGISCLLMSAAKEVWSYYILFPPCVYQSLQRLRLHGCVHCWRTHLKHAEKKRAGGWASCGDLSWGSALRQSALWLMQRHNEKRLWPLCLHCTNRHNSAALFEAESPNVSRLTD